MELHSNIIGRTIILCAFFGFGCTDSSKENSSPHKDATIITSQKLPNDKSPRSRVLSLLTLRDLLSASDVQKGLSLAASTNNKVLLLEWQNTLLQAAEKVKLDVREKNLLEGEQGLQYLAFTGMKINYQAAFQTAFVEFRDIEEIYRTYPAFIDLRERSLELIKQRDALIDSVANELTSQNFDGDTYEEAKRQWQVYIKTQATFNKSIKSL